LPTTFQIGKESFYPAYFEIVTQEVSQLDFSYKLTSENVKIFNCIPKWILNWISTFL